MSEIKDGFEQPTSELLDSIKPGDLVWVNDWHNPFQVKCVSSNYFVMTGFDDGEQMYSICSKKPFPGESHNGVCFGDFYCGPDFWTFGSALVGKHKDLYSFTNKTANRKYMESLESGETQISMRRMARIDRIRVLKMSSFKDHICFAEKYFGVQLLSYQKLILKLLWDIERKTDRRHNGKLY